MGPLSITLKGRAAGAALLCTACLLGSLSCYAQQTDPALPDTSMVLVYATAEWYRTQVAPEQQWTGRLQKRPAVVGPNTRASLKYSLHTEQGPLLVYAADVDTLLTPFVNHEVEVVGKLVDLSSEGFGPELWMASIRRVKP